MHELRRLTTARRAFPRRLSLLQNDFRVGCACYSCRHRLVKLDPEPFLDPSFSILSSWAFLSRALAQDFGCRHAQKRANRSMRSYVETVHREIYSSNLVRLSTNSKDKSSVFPVQGTVCRTA